VVDTMLHELSHNVFNEHDANFHALWNQLREEYESLVRKGYTGEGFLSEGKRLGGRRIPMDEARRLARVAAEKRRTLYAGSGQKLGGAGMPLGADPRKVIADAIERRTTVLKGCGSGKKDQKEIKAIADEATNSGFTTKAEEDEANDRAIAQALWELVQDEEREKYGESYIPPTAQNPMGNGGNSMPMQPMIPSGTRQGSTRPVSRLVQPSPPPLHSKPTRTHSSTQSSTPSQIQSQIQSQHSDSRPAMKRPRTEPPTQAASFPKSNRPIQDDIWECEICTCHNPVTFLCCDACGTERPAALSHKFAEASLTTLPTEFGKPSAPKTWTCHRCTTEMEEKWWTCSTCGAVKLSS